MLPFSIAGSYTRPGFRRTLILLQQCSVNREISLSFGKRPLTSYPSFRTMPVQDCLPADFTRHSEKIICLFSTLLLNSSAWKRISRAGTDTFPIGLPLPVSSVIAGFLQRSRRGVLLAFRVVIGLPGRFALGFLPHSGCLLRRPEVPYLLPRRTARHPLPLTVSVFSTSFTGCGRASLPEYPPENQTGLTGCLEAWVSFVHRVGRVHDPVMKF